jgi:hypothetical protein
VHTFRIGPTVSITHLIVLTVVLHVFTVSKASRARTRVCDISLWLSTIAATGVPLSMGKAPVRDEDTAEVAAASRVVSAELECATPSSATGLSRSAILGFGALSDAVTDELGIVDMLIVM